MISVLGDDDSFTVNNDLQILMGKNDILDR